MTVAIYGITQIWALTFMYISYKYRNTYRYYWYDSLLENGFKKNIFTKSSILSILSALPLFLLIVLRSREVGVDYHGYAEAIINIGNNQILDYYSDWLGDGFYYLIRIISSLGLKNDILVLIVISIIAFLSIYFLYKAILDNSHYPTVSLFIFFSFCLYYQMFNQFRQLLAITITTFAFKYIMEKNVWKYMAWILFATTIHNSAIVMLPIYYLCKLNINKKNITIYSLLSIIGYLQFGVIVKLLQHTTYGQIYLNWDIYNIANDKGAILNFIIRLFLLVICIIPYKRLVKKYKNINALYNMIIICTIIQLFVIKSTLFSRVTTYYFVFYIFLLPIVVKEYAIMLKCKEIIVLVFFYIMLLYHYIYFFFISSVESGYKVYKFFF